MREVLNLEFVEISELRGDMWVEDPPAGETLKQPDVHQPPPVMDNIKLWLECSSQMEALLMTLLVTCFPKKAPELWAYKTMILKATRVKTGSHTTVSSGATC